MSQSDQSEAGYADGIDGTENFDPIENLTGDDPDEDEETGYSPPDYEPKATKFGTTPAEEREGESLDQLLAEEEPDIDFDDAADDVTDARAGRLVAPDEGQGSDEESDAVAEDVGKAGFAATAEEAAMHIVDDERL